MVGVAYYHVVSNAPKGEPAYGVNLHFRLDDMYYHDQKDFVKRLLGARVYRKFVLDSVVEEVNFHEDYFYRMILFIIIAF